MENNTPQEIENVLIDEQSIKERVKSLASSINQDYAGKKIRIITVLEGAKPFADSLKSFLKVDCSEDLIKLKSYEGTETSGNINIIKDITKPISSEDHILIIEDLLDTGLTLSFLKKHLLSKNPASLKIAVLLDKVERRKVDVDVDYIGFQIPNKFVVGFGLDYEDSFRDLPFIGIIKEEVYR